MERRDSRAGARHRGTQRHVVATGGVSRARAFGYGLCECVCVVSNKRFAKFDTRTHNNTHHTNSPERIGAQQSAASLATSVSSEPPLPQQLSAIPTRPLPFLLCPFTLHTSFVSIHPCPHSSNAALCVFLSRPTSNILPCPQTPVLHALRSPSSAFFRVIPPPSIKREKA